MEAFDDEDEKFGVVGENRKNSELFTDSSKDLKVTL